MGIRERILLFSEFLRLSWEPVVKLIQEDEIEKLEESQRLADWLQANWEQMVELPLLGRGHFLQSYGHGADLFGMSDRVMEPSAHNDLIVHVYPMTGDSLRDITTQKPIDAFPLEFYALATRKDRFWFLEPPFDHVVCLMGQQECLFNIEDVDFRIEPVVWTKTE